MAQATLPAQASGLPARPNLSYLKKLAKERLRSLRQSNGSSKLADAQLAIAREHSFPSWRALKAHVDVAMRGASDVATDELSAKVDAFLAAAVSHHTDEKPFLLRRADALLAEDPRIAGANLLTACVLGTVKAAQAFLSRDAKAATHPAGPKNWPPILYLAFSRYLKFKPKLEAQFVAIARTLLDAGADPNSMFVHEGFNETPLYGAAGIANRPKLTKLLLDAGADPDDGGEKSGMESLYHAAEHLDNKCLRLILAKKPRRDAVSYCLARKLDFEDAAGTKLMLDQGTDSNFIMPAGSNCVLHAIRRGRSVEILKLLQSYGAQLDLPDKSSMTPLKLARRLGQKETIKFLLRAGVRDSLDVREQFLAACAAGSMRTAKKILKTNPDLIDRLTADEQQILPDAAAANHLWPVRHMLDLGFDINAKGDWGGASIHHAAWSGHIAMTKFLIHRGADLQQKNGFGGNALGTAVHSAIHNRNNKNGPEIIRILATAMKVADMTPYLTAALESNDPRVIESIQAVAAQKTKAVRTSKDWKPIMDAAFRGDAAAVRRLLKAGADPNIVSTTAQRYRPLTRAMESKKLTPRGPEHEEVVKALLEGGADPTLRGGFGRLDALLQAAVDGPRFIPLLRNRFGDLDIFHACALADDQRVAELLKRDRSLASSRDENDWMALHYCCASALYEDKKNADALVRIAQLLLKHGADPSATYSFEGNWPIPALYHACGQHNNPRVAEVLLRAGVSPCDNESVYHAADEGHAECLALIEKYTDKKALAKECTRALATQLHWNSSRGAPWLLAHGADPNFIHEKFGDSALHSAVKRRAGDEVIRLLLDHGADPFVKNRDGKSAIELAGGSASRKPNRPCPTGRDGKANTPQRKKTQSRILALLQRPSMQSKPRRRR